MQYNCNYVRCTSMNSKMLHNVLITLYEYYKKKVFFNAENNMSSKEDQWSTATGDTHSLKYIIAKILTNVL